MDYIDKYISQFENKELLKNSIRERINKLSLNSFSDNPKISIVIPSYNQGRYLEKTILSILLQDYLNYEIILIDGGSTDNSLEVINTYDEFFYYWVSEKDEGQADAINKGLAIASGEVFNWLNSDDYLEENALTKVADVYRKNKDAAGWVGACRRFDENGKTLSIIYPNNLERENIGQNWNGRQFYQPACFLNTNFVKKLGGVDKTLNTPFDLDLWIRILERGKFIIGKGIWAHALIHSEAKTQKTRNSMFNETISVQNKYGFTEGAENRFERVFNGKKIEFIIPEELRKTLNSYEQSPEKNSQFNISNKDIIFISKHLPRFDKTSSNKRVYEILTILLANKFNITYVYRNSSPDENKYKSSLNGNIRFIQRDFSVTDYIDIITSSKASYVWITNLWEESYFHFINDLLSEIQRKFGIKIIVDTMDFHYKKFLRRYNVTKNESDLKRAEIFLEEERKLYPKAEIVLTVTENEKEDILKSIQGINKIEVIPNIHEENKIQKKFSDRRNICFLGNFGVNHNADAARFFANKIFPVIREYVPDIEFHLIGNEAEKLTGEFSLPGVKIIGYVENLNEILVDYKLFVCPMLYGAGLKGKIGEAAASGLPIVTTSIGAEGSFLEDGVDCFIADDVDEFVFKCIHVLNDYICWNNFSIKSKLKTLRNYGKNSVSVKLGNLFNNQLNFDEPDDNNKDKNSGVKRLIRAGAKSLFGSDLLKINWVITRKCNYKCSYCNVYDNVTGYFQPLEKLKTAVDQIALLNRKNIHITLTGGEPTLHPDYAEFMFYITGKLKNKILISTITNLSRTKRYFTELCAKLQPYTGNINFRASYHFEFADKDKFIENAKLIADQGFVIYISILAHPDKMDEVRYLESQFKEITNDKLKYEIIVVRENYGTIPDKRYSTDDLDTLKNHYTKATDHKGIILDWEYTESKSIERGYFSLPELNAKGLNKFKGMLCNAGINMFSIDESGGIDKAVCFRKSKYNKKNIYTGNNVIDEISEPVVCPFDSCGCLADLQLPKYLPGYENLSTENRVGRDANDLLITRLNLIGWEYKSDIYKKDFTSVQELRPVNSPKLTVVVISWRLHQDTLKNFQILEQQRNINFELIFVNNGGNDKDFEPLKPFINTYIRLNRNTGAYVARNIGSVFAKSDILLFLEDDGIPEQNLLKQHLRIYNEYYVIALRGVYLPKTNNPINRTQSHYYLGEIPIPYYLNLEGNLSIKAESFFKIGGFNDEIIYGHGGADLSYRLKKLYPPEIEPSWYFPQPKIYHDYASTSNGLKDKIQMQERSLQNLKKKYDGFEQFIEKYRNHYRLLTFQKEYNVNKLAEESKSYLRAYKIPNNELNLRLFDTGWMEREELYRQYFTSIEFRKIINSPLISVIIISWRLHPDTLRNFEILQKQRNQNFELIFVDNGGKEGEFEKLKPFIDTYIKLNTNTGAYLARNIGALFANAPILFFLEDDGIPADDLIEAHLNNHNKYDIIALRGVYIPKTSNPLNKIAAHYYLGDKPKSIFADLEGNTSYKASIFFKAGGWDDKINFGGGGVDLALRLLKIDNDKRKQIYSPEPVIYHDYAVDENHLAVKKEKQQKSREYLRAKHPGYDEFLQSWSMYLEKPVFVLKNSGREIRVVNIQAAHDGTEFTSGDRVLKLSKTYKPEFPSIFYNYYSIEKATRINKNDAFWFTEPYAVIPQNYSHEFLNQFPLIYNWNRKFLRNFPNSSVIPHAHWSGIKDIEKIFQTGLNWDERKDEILFIGNLKSSSHSSELYSLRIKAADWLYENSNFEVSWYSRMPIDRPYYKGSADKKINFIEGTKFIFCPENSYDALYTWDYLTEKIFDAFVGKAVPIYMGCYNIDEYFNNYMYIDLREYVKKNNGELQTDFNSLHEKLKSFNEDDYIQQQDLVKQFFKNNPQFFQNRVWSNVYRQVLNNYDDFLKRKRLKKTDDYESAEIKRIEKGYIFTGDYYLKNEIEKLVKEFNIKSVIETGTSEGNSTREISKFAENVFSIEIVPDTFEKTKEKLKDIDNVNLFLGNSPEVLKEILKSAPRPVLFFLDAHWYDYWPILDELKVIKSFPDLKESIIVIHDFYVPGKDFGYDSYKGQKLDYEYIKHDLLAINPDYKHYYNSRATGKKRGVIFIHPEKENLRIMNNENPLISICIPTYNRSGYLKEAIKSVLNQKYDNLEIVIVDDGSTDNTVEVVKGFASPKIRYIKKENEGRPKTRNRLVSEAKGDFILWLDDDDLLAEGMIEIYYNVLKNDPSIDVIYGNLQAFDSESGNKLQLFEPDDYTNDSNQVLANLINGKGITFGGSLIRKKLIEQAGGFDEEFLRAQDNELWTRLALKAKFHKLNKVIYFYRKHNTNISMNDFVDRSYESKIIRKIISEYSLQEIYPSLSWENYNEAKSKAVIGIMFGLAGFGDFYNAVKILIEKKTQLCAEDLMLLFTLYLKSGDIHRVGELLNLQSERLTYEQKNSVKMLLNEYAKLSSLLGESNLEIVRSELERFIKSQGYSHISAFLIGTIFQRARDYTSAYRHLKNAVYFNPGDEGLYKQVYDLALKLGTEEDLSAMRKRMLEEIIFFADKKKTVDGLVSVIIPTYNRPQKLANAIESVLSQTYKNFEIIVVKDGGKNISNIIKKYKDDGIRFINHNKNKGPSSARNAGIKAAKGKYIALLDDDDIFYPNHLEIALTCLNERNKVIYTDAARCTYIKEGNSPEADYKLQSKSVPYSIDYNRNKLLVGNISPINCFVFEKSLTDKIGLFDESLQVLEDWEFWLRLSSVANFKHIRENTVQVNWYNDGSTLTSSKQEAFGKLRTSIYKKYENEINAIPNMNEIVKEFNVIWQKDSVQPAHLVSIITLTYNQVEYTKAFVESVFKYTKIPFELILVDNNSNDETVKYLTELSRSNGSVKVIFNKENLGFPKGVNQGLKLSAGKYILISNNDIIVTDGWLNKMIEIAESDSSIGIVGPISNSVSGVQLDKEAAYSSIEEMHAYAQRIKVKNAGNSFAFPRVAFLCTLIKGEVINKIGGLDERFSPGNFEDDDFCLRAQIAGYKTIIAQDVFIHHFGSKSFTAEGLEKYKEHLETNKNIFINKWNADPEEIWLKGKSIKERNIMYPINNNRFIESFERARILIEDREYDTALDSLKVAVDNFDDQYASQFNIDRSDLLNLAGNIALLNNEPAAAKEYFEYALNKNPQSSPACAGLAEILFIEKNFEAAKTMFEYAVSYDKNNAGAQEGLKRINSVLESYTGYEMQPNNKNNLFQINKRNDFGHLFNSLNLFGHGVEIGVQAGEFSQILRSAWKGKYLHLIDRWQNIPDYKDICNVSDDEQKKLYNLVINTFINDPGVFIYKMDSAFAAGQFPDEHFDWIYIDADHSYKGCKKDLELWYPKLKPGGVFAGHDFINGTFTAGEFGVKAAVEEFIKNKDVELYLTIEDYLKSWYFIKPGVTQTGHKSEYKNSLKTMHKEDEKENDNLVNEAYDLFKSKNYNESLNKLFIAEKQFNGQLSEPAYSIMAAAFFSLKGYNYLGLNRIEEAKESFEHALNLNPNSSEACAGLGEYFFINGNDEHARIMFEFAVKNNPENSFAIEGLSKLKKPNEDDSQKLGMKLDEILSSVFELFELKKFSEALEALKSTEELFYSQSENEEKNHLISSYENMKGMIFLALKSNEDAKKCFELALSINPNSSQACAGLGEIFYLSGNDKEAKTMYEWAVKYNPGNRFALEGLGKINSILGLEKNHTSLEK